MAALRQSSLVTSSLQNCTAGRPKHFSSSAPKSSLFGERLQQPQCEGRISSRSSRLVCNAVTIYILQTSVVDAQSKSFQSHLSNLKGCKVWWSDAAKELQPDWQQAHERRVEILQALEQSYETGQEATTLEEPNFFEEVIAVGKDALFGGGIAQEMIIGRTAMLGFFTAMTVEIESGLTVSQQLTVRGGVALMMVSLAVVAGSLAPRINELLKNDIQMHVKPFQGFTANAERLNGQAAMVGFVLLLATEYLKGSPVF